MSETHTYWRACTELWRPVEVRGGRRLGGQDADGKTIFSNTHFDSEAKAWARLEDEAVAIVRLAGARVDRAEAELLLANAQAGQAAKAFRQLQENKKQEVTP